MNFLTKKKSRIRCKSGNSLCSSIPTKTKKSKQEDFYNEHTAEIILFESAKKYLKENLGKSKILNISKWKSELSTLEKEKKGLYNQAKKWYYIK